LDIKQSKHPQVGIATCYYKFKTAFTTSFYNKLLQKLVQEAFRRWFCLPVEKLEEYVDFLNTKQTKATTQRSNELKKRNTLGKADTCGLVVESSGKVDGKAFNQAKVFRLVACIKHCQTAHQVVDSSHDGYDGVLVVGHVVVLGLLERWSVLVEALERLCKRVKPFGICLTFPVGRHGET
jgi:hypothetical protein